MIGVEAGLILLALLATPAGAITWGEADEGQHPNVGATAIADPESGEYYQTN